MNKWYHLDKPHIQNPLKCDRFLLYQTGRIFCDQNYAVDEHSHLEWIELTVVTDGVGKVSANGIAVPVKKGDVFVSFPCDTHQVISSPDNPLKFDFLTFYPTDENTLKSLESLFIKFASAQNRVISGQKIAPLVQEVIVEVDSNALYSQKLISSILEQISIHLIRSFESGETITQKTSATQLCYSIMNYIDTHVYTLQKLEDVAPKFNYNYRYLTTLFKKTTGKTLHEYFQSRKLETAKVLISENKYKICEISSMLNYSSPFAFSKAFKNKFNVSPKFIEK